MPQMQQLLASIRMNFLWDTRAAEWEPLRPLSRMGYI
ncbi:hypothetical protein FOQG_19450 [Fusarium oxysporum f. sp. raphani 54005]|uniref:Uncharacterized protein n=1 Tax=Fusarium oxysporum f. sp. raphani 54005 TaxID=1089458 RepID=X0B103_FUSOX|nr:hypothetical protein FOQG_19450 [Fusarium oxysporum f. sp. raphani 54005]